MSEDYGDAEDITGWDEQECGNDDGDDFEDYEYVEDEDDVVLTPNDYHEGGNTSNTTRSHFNNTFDYLMPDSGLVQSAVAEAEALARISIEQYEYNQNEAEQNKKQKLESNKQYEWWESAEYLAIFQVLKYILKNSHSYQISLDWNHLNQKEFRQPLFTITSNKSIEIVYMFNLSFQSNANGVYPEVPPKIIPHFFMPAPLYFFTLHFPLLLTKYWNPCQDLGSVIEILCSLWDEVLGSSPKYANDMYNGALLDGSISEYPQTPVELKAFLAAANEDCSFELLLSLWFGSYQNECNYDFGDLHTILEGLGSGGSGAGDNTTSGSSSINSLSSVRNILSACPKQIVKATIASGSGIGYSKGESKKGHTIERPWRLNVLEKLSLKIDSFVSSKSLEELGLSRMKRIVNWLLQSPLLHLIFYELSQMSTGDALHHANDLMCYFVLMNHIDRMIQQLHLMQGGDLSTILNDSQRQLILNIFHIASIRWIDNGMLDDIDIQETDPATVSTVIPTNTGSAASISSIATSKVIDKQALQDFKTRTMTWCSTEQINNMSVATANGESSSVSLKTPQKLVVETVEKVFYIDGLENYSFFKDELTKGSKCPKFFIRELKTLNESLADNIRVYASETSPNLLKVTMFIENDECPYYGGAYLFDIFIPSTYPAVSPQVKFLTTGRGTVRFNPNLYQCGKVCLSLLGTWAGEPWDPKTSNLTQVLNSILFLIFTKEPYYNEPGFARSAASIKESDAYDINVLFNSMEFAMADYFHSNSLNVTGCEQILQDIREYYIQHWEALMPAVLNKVNYYTEKVPSRREIALARKHLDSVTKWIATNKPPELKK